ncbi:MAG: hypothetical protein GC185_10790 [Alphaproteobacteria bacterium]|nr:hypothetical protein [Alphaproteobacteria bacterium]
MVRLSRMNTRLLPICGQVFRHPLFWLGLAVKLVLVVSCASRPLQNLFIPFVDYFVQGGHNPYAHFMNKGVTDAFPYPAVMLYVMAASRWVFFFLPKLLAYKLPLLAADTTILLVLASWMHAPLSRLLKVYWLSPVLIYISYVHGQLDAVPVALLFVSLYFLFKDRWNIALVWLGLAVAAKTSIVLALPLMFIYIFFRRREEGSLALLLWVLLPLVSFCAANIFFLADSDFIRMVFLNASQNKLLLLQIPYGDASLYVAPVVYMFLLGQAVFLRLKSQAAFLLFTGFSFGLITLCVIPMPGWYFWPLPFWAYFYAQSSYREKHMFFALQAAYFLYFLVVPQSDYMTAFAPVFPAAAGAGGVNAWLAAHGYAQGAVNLCFSALQGALLLTLFWLYRRGVGGISDRRLVSRPFLVGIGGDSGAGKTTISEYLLHVFGARNVTVVRGDDMHKWERGDPNWQSFTHLDPRANRLHKEYEDLHALKYDRNILRVSYNHAVGRFSEDEKTVSANRLVIYEGLHPFYLRKVRELFDLKIFAAPDPDLAMYWKVRRDMRERGYTHEQALAHIEKRRDDYRQYIASQEGYADISIKTHLEDSAMPPDGEEEPKTYLEFRCINAVNLDPLLDRLGFLREIEVSHTYGGNDYQYVIIRGVPLARDIAMLARMLPLARIGVSRPEWLDGQAGLIQLFVTYAIFFEAGIGHET